MGSQKPGDLGTKKGVKECGYKEDEKKNFFYFGKKEDVFGLNQETSQGERERTFMEETAQNMRNSQGTCQHISS